MNRHDLDRLARWAFDADKKQFAEDAYGIVGTAYDRTDDYISGKFKQMQNNFIMWLGGLDSKNRGRLARNITFNEWDKEEEFDPNEIGIEATKIMMSTMNKKGE